MSGGLSRKTLYAIILILVVMVVGQAGWLMLYIARADELEKKYASMEKSFKELQVTITQLQSRISDESVVGSLAYRHWSALCNRNLTMIMSQYAPDAKLYWLGCPIQRNCTTLASIEDQWRRFFESTKGQGLCTCVSSLSVRLIPGFHAGFTGAVVNARLSFCCPEGSQTAGTPALDCACPEVRYGLVYMLREGKWVLVDEWWVVPPRWHPYISY
jgi:hypothetical protein